MIGKTSLKSSNLVILIPLAVAAIILGVVLIAAGENNDLRSHASTESQDACVAACTQTGGTGCEDTCKKLDKGDVSCRDLHPAAFVNWCTARVNTVCTNKCDKPGALSRGCRQVCNAVLGWGKSCNVACSAQHDLDASSPGYVPNVGRCVDYCQNDFRDTRTDWHPSPSPHAFPTRPWAPSWGPTGASGASGLRDACVDACNAMPPTLRKPCIEKVCHVQ